MYRRWLLKVSHSFTVAKVPVDAASTPGTACASTKALGVL